MVFGNKPLTKINLQKYLSNEVFVKLPEFVGFMIVGFKLLQTKTRVFVRFVSYDGLNSN